MPRLLPRLQPEQLLKALPLVSGVSWEYLGRGGRQERRRRGRKKTETEEEDEGRKRKKKGGGRQKEKKGNLLLSELQVATVIHQALVQVHLGPLRDRLPVLGARALGGEPVLPDEVDVVLVAVVAGVVAGPQGGHLTGDRGVDDSQRGRCGRGGHEGDENVGYAHGDGDGDGGFE